MKHIILGTMILVGLSYPYEAPLHAQESAADPLAVAVRYVLSVEEMEGLGRELAIDTRNPGHGPGPETLSPHASSVARRIARDLDADVRELSAVLSCPAERPRVDHGYRGCTLSGHTKAVLMLDDPVPTDDGVLVWVTVFRVIDNPEINTHYVSSLGRQLELVQDETGTWTVADVGSLQFGRW